MSSYTEMEKAYHELTIARKAVDDFAAALSKLPPEIRAALIKRMEADEVATDDPRQKQLPNRENKPL
jgi:hypothetical protein